MKIAVASADKTTVVEHFGTAPYFVVLEVEGENIVNEEVREKPAHKVLSKEEEHAQVDGVMLVKAKFWPWGCFHTKKY